MFGLSAYSATKCGEYSNDSTDVGLGSVLSEIQDSQKRFITYVSKVMLSPEKNYSVASRKLLIEIRAASI